ncbi:energy transducer TonB [Qipengyuania sp.]|uniref:energy transducer TonB n=1 Tax=Qipengyuania sp. TaxID=2004515 RepID=UPI0035C8536B
MSRTGSNFAATRRWPNGWVLAAIVIAHVVAFYGLIRIFAPDAVAGIERTVLSTFSVTVTAPPPPPPPENQPEPDEGAAGDPGREAVPQPVTAPSPKIPIKPEKPLPRASSTGSANTSGATQSGEGTGAAGNGSGTGSGRGGGGQGGLAVTKPVKIAGDINSASDFPVPPGGRQARFGTAVTVAMTVRTDGRASNCRVLRPSGDPVADHIVCRLAVERFRFRPATDSAGNPVPATYGWRQEWFRN